MRLTRWPGALFLLMSGVTWAIVAVAKCPSFVTTWDRVEQDTDDGDASTPSRLFVSDFDDDSFAVFYFLGQSGDTETVLTRVRE